MCASTSPGMPSSRRVRLRAWRSGGSAKASDSGHVGSVSVSRLSTLTATFGACAAAANSLYSSSTFCPFGSVRWKALPSRSGSCAMWSSAPATQSTGTTFVLPMSSPTSGSHSGISLRVRWIALKK